MVGFIHPVKEFKWEFNEVRDFKEMPTHRKKRTIMAADKAARPFRSGALAGYEPAF